MRQLGGRNKPHNARRCLDKGLRVRYGSQGLHRTPGGPHPHRDALTETRGCAGAVRLEEARLRPAVEPSAAVRSPIPVAGHGRDDGPAAPAGAAAWPSFLELVRLGRAEKIPVGRHEWGPGP